MNTKEAANMLNSLKYTNAEKEFETEHNDNLSLIINLLNSGKENGERLQEVRTELLELHDSLEEVKIQ